MNNPWYERYSKEEYIYGKDPNVYIKEKLDSLNPGKILFPAEGEGRNSVYAAKNGWEVYGFDASSAGKTKAEALAKANGVKIHYEVLKTEEADYPKDSFDALVFSYAHFPGDRRSIHRKLAEAVKPGGILILEAFNKDQIHNQKVNLKAGGPKNIEMLYDLEEIKEDFKDFEFMEAKNEEVMLKEGDHHVGKGNVVRIFGRKR